MPRMMALGIYLGITLSFSAAQGQDVAELIRSIDGRQQKIQTLTAHFSQKKETALVKAPLLSSGTVKYKRPNRIYWQYDHPEATEMALDGKKMVIYSPGRGQAEQYSLTRGHRLTQFLEPLTNIFQKTFAQLEEGYAISYDGLEGDRLYRFGLMPKEARIQKFLSRVDLGIDKTSGAILRFKMLEANGDCLSLEFTNLQINPPLTDDDLQIKIPPSVRVQEQGGP